MPKLDRKNVLLRAAYDILTKCSRSHYIRSVNETTAFYDDAVCDTTCLIVDIADILGIPETSDPIPVPHDHRDLNPEEQ